MNTILKKRVPASKRDTNLGLSSRRRWRDSLAQWVIVGIFAMFFPLTSVVSQTGTFENAHIGMEPPVLTDEFPHQPVSVFNFPSDTTVISNPVEGITYASELLFCEGPLPNNANNDGEYATVVYTISSSNISEPFWINFTLAGTTFDENPLLGIDIPNSDILSPNSGGAGQNFAAFHVEQSLEMGSRLMLLYKLNEPNASQEFKMTASLQSELGILINPPRVVTLMKSGLGAYAEFASEPVELYVDVQNGGILKFQNSPYGPFAANIGNLTISYSNPQVKDYTLITDWDFENEVENGLLAIGNWPEIYSNEAFIEISGNDCIFDGDDIPNTWYSPYTILWFFTNQQLKDIFSITEPPTPRKICISPNQDYIGYFPPQQEPLDMLLTINYKCGFVFDGGQEPGLITVEPTHHNFGNVAIASLATQTFTLSRGNDYHGHLVTNIKVMEMTTDEVGNVTTIDSTIIADVFGNATTTKMDYNEFIISNNECSETGLSSSSECQFSIKFQPKSEGQKKAIVVVRSFNMDGAILDLLTAPLQGNGIKPDPSEPKISVEPMSHDFGEVYVQFSDDEMIKVSNIGTAPFEIGKITIAELTMPAMGGGFSIKSDFCSEQKLAPASFCFVVIEFQPPSIGDKSANLLIPYGPKTPVYVPLKGTGVDWCPNPPIVQVKPDPIDFGSVSIGHSMSLPVSIRMKAKGCKLPLQIDDITVIGPDAGELTIVKPLWCKSGIHGKTSYSYCKSKLTFNAAKPAGIKDVELKDVELEIAFNDNTTKTVPIKAEAIIELPNPQFEVEPTAYDFGNVVIGTSSEPAKFIVTNTGNVTLWPGIFKTSGGDEDDFKVIGGSCVGLKSLLSGENCSISVVFKPWYPPGQKKTKLIIPFSSSIPPHEVIVVKVLLTGMAIEPKPCSDASITIETRQSGIWSDPLTWSRIRPPIDSLTTPNSDDVVRINKKHTVTAPSSTIKVKALCIEKDGTLESKHSTISLRVDAKERIENKGTIRKQDDDGGIVPGPWGADGASINLIVGKVCYLPWALDESPVSKIPAPDQDIAVPEPYYWCYYEGAFHNEGTIIAGDAIGSSAWPGYHGGNITIRAGNINIIGSCLLVSKICYGAICAGNGSAGQPGGDGGNISIIARNQPLNQSSVYMKCPYIEAGDGGKGIDGTTGGDGGDLKVGSNYIIQIQGSPIILRAGEGGTPNGNDGEVNIDPRIISISGEETEISGGNVTLSGGEDAIIELNGLNEGAITATGDLTLAVGEGGVIMTDSTDKILKAEGQVNLFADEIMLGEDVNVSDITGDNVVIGSGQIMRDVSIMASGNSSGEPGITLPFEVTFFNNGSETDTYLLTVTDEEGWSLSQLPSFVEIEGHGTAELTLEVVLPTTLDVTNVITVTAISLADLEVIATSEISIAVTTETQDTVVGSGAISANVCPSTGTINKMCNNQGRVVKDATLEPEANLVGGHFSGTIVNKGIISQATVAKDAVLKGGKLTGYIVNNGSVVDIEFVGASLEGGELSGKIVNNSQVGGVFINVRLAANTSIEGGAVQGEVGGDAQAPASLKNVRVKPGSRLSNVILGDDVQLEGEAHFAEGVRLGPNIRLKGGKVKGMLIGEAPDAPAVLEDLEVQAGSTLANVIIGEQVQLPKDVVLGEGTRFTRRADIPSGVELMGLLPALPANSPEGMTYPKRADFSADVVEPSDGLLSAINELPALKDNAWALQQDAELSHLELSLDQVRFVVLPVSVKKTTASGGLEVQGAQRVRFITDTGLDVLTEPALQAPNALLSALSELGVSEVTVQANGNLQIPASEGLWFSARPEWLSIELGSDTETGLKFGELPYGSEFISASLVFTDSDGKPREQHLYPSLAQPEVLSSLAQTVHIEADGLINFKLGNQTYRGVMDYAVTQNESTTDMLQVESIPDANGDGIEDVVLIYPNGEQQIMFVLE